HDRLTGVTADQLDAGRGTGADGDGVGRRLRVHLAAFDAHHLRLHGVGAGVVEEGGAEQEAAAETGRHRDATHRQRAEVRHQTAAAVGLQVVDALEAAGDRVEELHRHVGRGAAFVATARYRGTGQRDRAGDGEAAADVLAGRRRHVRTQVGGAAVGQRIGALHRFTDASRGVAAADQGQRRRIYRV